MKKYEKDLQKLIKLSQGGCEPIHQTDCGMEEKQLRFLAAKGFVSLRPAGNNEFWIVLNPAGLSHFSDKDEAREAFIKEHVAGFLSGFASGVLVTVAANWLIQSVL